MAYFSVVGRNQKLQAKFMELAEMPILFSLQEHVK